MYLEDKCNSTKLIYIVLIAMGYRERENKPSKLKVLKVQRGHIVLLQHFLHSVELCIFLISSLV